MATTENDNWQLGKDLPASVVDDLADELVKQFDNELYRRWYCAAIYDLGLSKIDDLRKKVVTGDKPGKLFSFYVKQERNALRGKWRLNQMKKRLDD